MNLTAFKRFALSMLIIGGSFAYASALTISPARSELSGDPGSTITGEFLVINEQDTNQVFYTSAENFEAQGESGTPNFVASQEGLASWIHLEDHVELKKGERAKIPFSITIPKDADAGGHFAAIFLSTVPPTGSGSQVAVGAKVGMLVLLKVNGDIKEGGGVLSFGVKDTPHFITSLPVTFVYRFSNKGNDRVNPTGDIVIRDSIGLESDRINANPASGNVLPGSTRRYEVEWGNGDKISDDSGFFDHVRYEAANFALGFYSASMHLTFGSSGNATDSTWFIVFPWHLMVVVIIILMLLFFVGRGMIKRYNRWIIQQAKLSMHH